MVGRMNIVKKFVLLVLASSIYGLAITAQEDKLGTPIMIFDLNGVFFRTHTRTVLYQIGLKSFVRYFIRHRSINLKERFFSILNKIADTDGNQYDLKDPDGKILPELMACWLRGSRSNTNILNQIYTAIAAHPEWFMSSIEQQVIKKMAGAIFTPEQFVKSRKFISDLTPLVSALKKRGITLYILSNWDKESFELLQNKYSTFFAQFDRCFISGNIGYVKPEPELFQYIKSLHDSNFRLCLLDDQIENIIAAQRVGIDTILVKPDTSLFSSRIQKKEVFQHCLIFLKKCRGLFYQPDDNNNKPQANHV